MGARDSPPFGASWAVEQKKNQPVPDGGLYWMEVEKNEGEWGQRGISGKGVDGHREETRRRVLSRVECDGIGF